MNLFLKKHVLLTAAVVLAGSVFMSACSSSDKKADDQSATDQASGPALDDAYAGKLKGKKVTMFGPFADADEVKFTESIKNFEEKTGIDIQYEGSKSFESTITVRVDGGNAPDIADFPQPGLLGGFVKKGKVVDVQTVIPMDKLKSKYNQSWIDMSMMDSPNGKIVGGIWSRSNAKGLVWYPKKAWEEAGYKIPTTWDELKALSDQIVKDGDAPFCIGIESGDATGWAATDWTEQIMLRTQSPETYDKWVRGEIPFTDPMVKNAVDKLSEIWLHEGYVYGGVKSIVTTSFGDSPKPMFDNPPKCYMHNQGNFITSFFPNTVKAGVDYDFFNLPSIDPQYGQPVEVGGDIYAMFNDRPEVRAVLEFFTTGESIKSWVSSGGVLGPMNDVDLSWYGNDVDRKMAQMLKDAKTIRFDGSDLMPGAVGAGTFWKGMTDYISGAVDEDTALKQIQEGWNKK